MNPLAGNPDAPTALSVNRQGNTGNFRAETASRDELAESFPSLGVRHARALGQLLKELSAAFFGCDRVGHGALHRI